MTTTTTSPRRRLWIATTTVALVTAVGGAIWLTSEPSTASVSVAETAATLDTVLSEDSDQAGAESLRRDLKAARALEGSDKLDALKKVRSDARAGEYGDKVEKKADRRADRRAARFALLPDELQADLEKLKSMSPGEDRKAFRKQIRADALAGTYGDKVKEAAELLKKD